MKILAVDYGQKRLGLAFADTNLDVVLPYGLITESKLARQVAALVKIIAHDAVGRVVIGFPLSLSGAENKNTARVKEFAFELGKATSVAVEFFDERLSSRAADEAGGSVSRDERAAVIILSDYLSRRS